MSQAYVVGVFKAFVVGVGWADGGQEAGMDLLCSCASAVQARQGDALINRQGLK